MRFLGQVGEPSDSLIRKLTELDYRHDMAFVALSQEGGVAHAVGVSRYSVAPDGLSCECAVTVADAWQGKGLGTVLMRDLIDYHAARLPYDASDDPVRAVVKDGWLVVDQGARVA